MVHKDIADTLIKLKDADLLLRDKLIQNSQLGDGYNEEMEKLHIRNAETLHGIINEIGYPTTDLVGTEANEAAWLITQHAISCPLFMKKCARLLETIVSERNENPKHLAYLTDRIAGFEDKPQLYGTQFDWDETGILSPLSYDDKEKVNERRKLLGFNTLEEQTEILRKQAKNENQLPPKDFETRKNKYDNWRRKVGWIK